MVTRVTGDPLPALPLLVMMTMAEVNPFTVEVNALVGCTRRFRGPTSAIPLEITPSLPPLPVSVEFSL